MGGKGSRGSQFFEGPLTATLHLSRDPAAAPGCYPRAPSPRTRLQIATTGGSQGLGGPKERGGDRGGGRENGLVEAGEGRSEVEAGERLVPSLDLASGRRLETAAAAFFEFSWGLEGGSHVKKHLRVRGRVLHASHPAGRVKQKEKGQLSRKRCHTRTFGTLLK